MRAEFIRTDDGSRVVASASWDGRHAVVQSDDESIRKTVERIFRATPVVVDDPAYRSLGAHGASVIQPGSIEWFRAAAFARAGEAGLRARLVPEVTGQGGWDPAAAYRTFDEAVERLFRRPADGTGRDQQPGEEGPEERADTGDQPRGSDAPPTVQ
jgi:hypothetical protein